MAGKADIQQRLQENLSRVTGLNSTYVRIGKKVQGRRSAGDSDVLRAAVVLLHATLEDFLRSIARWKLPLTSDAAVLDKVPFAGSKDLRPKKEFMGHLIQYKGKSVNEVIETSVQEYLAKVSYSGVDDISDQLVAVGIDKSQITCNFAILGDMIKRRHQIVHEADRTEAGKQGKHRVRSISTGQLAQWIDTVKLFCEDVLKQL